MAASFTMQLLPSMLLQNAASVANIDGSQVLASLQDHGFTVTPIALQTAARVAPVDGPNVVGTWYEDLMQYAEDALCLRILLTLHNAAEAWHPYYQH